MTRNNIILKSISHLFLGVMLYMHFCSAWCAMFSGGDCCNVENDNCKKTFCSRERKSDSKDQGCQDFHLSFFKASGQFASEKNVDVVKVFPLVTAGISTIIFIKPIETSQYLFAFSNYHPPPPLADIRVFIQSFQI